ncbi:FAD-dependent oxidoreductase, partial [Candidatus Sumerlaeota bacterium]|nr:FAD-dependent oxidoreductase [Candidatus Sumerlaeota bacterium]
MGKNVLIIGGVAAGTKAAARARRIDPSLNITLITDEPFISYAGCGLPYYIGGVVKDRNQLFAYTPERFAERNKVNVLVRHRAIRLDAKNRVVIAQNLNEQTQVKFSYDSLLIATGAQPIRPALPGSGLKNIFTLRNPDDADAIIGAIKSPGVRRVVVVGGGLIGLETVENLLLHSLEVRVVELLNQLLPPLDEDFAWLVEKHLVGRGVAISKSDGVKAFESAGDDERVGIVITEHNRFPADVVILSIGARPNVGVAEAGGIELGETGAIKVDPTMRTNYPDIFAAGDCVESRHLVTGRPTYAGLGSVANRQGRVAGSNLAGLKSEFPGVAGSMIARVCE